MAFWQVAQPLQGAVFYWDSDATAAGNAVSGAGLGGSGTWDISTPNWWDGSADVAWPNSLLDTALFSGLAGTVTLGGSVNASTLMFRTTDYALAAGTLTLGDVARVDVAPFTHATIGSVIAGSSGLTKTGNGTLFLTSAANTYTGDTVIRAGTVVITNEAQLGTSTTAIGIHGSANTGNPGYSGGQLIVNGTGAPVTMTREIGVSGRGPGTANGVGGLTSIGNNTFNGDITLGGPGSEARFMANYGVTTVNGDVYLGSSVPNYFLGNGNFIVNGRISGIDTAVDRFIKTGNVFGTTLWLTNPANDFRQTIRIDSGTVRVSTALALGVSTAAQAIDLNGGVLEIHQDTPDFTGRLVRKRGNGGGIFVDHAFDSTVLNQTVDFGNLLLDLNASLVVTGRSGYGASFTGAGGTINWTNGGTGAITNNSNGLLTIGANINRLTETSARTFTFSGSGNTVFTGSLLQVGTGAVSLTKDGVGIVTMLGTAATATGTSTINAGTLRIAGMGSLPSGALNIGNATTTSGSLEYIGAGETSSKPLLLNTTTASVYLHSNGTGALVLNGAITAVNGNKTFVLGGTNTDANEIASAIPAAGGTLNLQKIGAGTWVLSGANLYTGVTTVAGGTLQLKDAFSGSSRNVVVDTSNVTFNVDTFTQSAGGIFEYLGDGANASAESVGQLIGAAGAGTVKVTAGAGGTAALTFSSLGTISAGSGINFVTNAGASVILTGAASVNGILNAHLYYNGADFAAGSTVGAAAYTTESAGASLAAGNTTPYLVNTADITAQATATINAGIKFAETRSLTLASAAVLTINNGANSAGGILVTGGSAVTISGGNGITSGGSGDLVFRTDTLADTLTLETPITSSSTGGWTKLGAGTLILNAANANTTGGQVHIDEGKVQLTGAGRLGADSMDVRIRQGATLDLNGISLGTAASGTAAIDELNGAGTLTNTGVAASLRIGNGNGSSYFTGTLSGPISLTKAGTGTIRVQGPQSYNGVVTLVGGNLDVTTLADIGSASGIGLGDDTSDETNAASLVFNGGALRYLGQDGANIYQTTGTPSVSIDRLFTLAGNGSIANFGSTGQNASQGRAANHATLVFNNPAPVAFSGSGNRTLTLRGDSQGDNQINLQMIDNPNGGTLSISKADTGLWILGNALNSYSGTTTISGGALRAQDGSTLPTASNLFLSGGNGVFQTSGTFGRALGTGAGQVRFTANGNNGFAAASTPLTVNLGTSGLVWGSSNSPTAGTTNFIGAGSLYLSSSTSWADTTFMNSFEVTQGVAAALTISTNSNTTVDITTGNTHGLTVGQAISGTNIPAGSYITSINSATQISISANATATGTGISGTVATGGFRQIVVDDNANTGLDFVTVSGVISGAGGLGKAGAGVLILGNANTYSGNTVLRDGGLFVTSIGGAGSTSSSLGTNVGGGFLELGNPSTTTTINLMYVGNGETATRPIYLTGTTGTRRIDSSGSGALILTALSNSTALSVNTTGGAKTLELRGSNTDGNMITSVLGDNGGALTVTKVDSGVWILNPGTPNTFTGALTAGGGMLGLTANGIGNAANLTLSNGAIFAVGGPLTVSKNVSWVNNTTAVFAGSNDITLNGSFTVASGNNDGTFSNNLENGALLTINANFTNAKANDRNFFIRGYGSTVWNGIIQNATANTTGWDIRIHSNASFTTTGAANTYTGGKLLGQGILILDKVNGLGPSGNFTFDGGTLMAGPNISDLTGGNALVNPVILAGDLVTFGGTKSIELDGVLTVSGGTRILVNDISSGTLTLDGAVAMANDGTNRTLVVQGSGETVINGVVQNGSTATASALLMRGTGRLTLANANTYDGATSVTNGVLALSGNGTLDQTSVITVTGKGTLRLDNSAIDLADRVSNNTALDINLDGGLLDFISDGVESSETFARLDINGNGLARIQVSGGGSSTLTFAAVNFANTGSTLDLTGVGGLGGDNKVLFTTPPTGTAVSNGIMPRVVVGADFAEYHATNGVQAFTAYNTSNDLVTATTTDTMHLTAGASIALSRTLNALKLSGGGLTVGSSVAGAQLTLSSGAVLAVGGAHTLDVPLLNTGANGGFFQVAGGTSLEVNSTITGAAYTQLQGGSVSFNTPQYFISSTNLHGGTLTLNGGLNTIMPLKQSLFISPGATLDLNGNTQFVGNLTTSSDQPDGGGTVTSSTGTGTIITDNGGSWMGTVMGNVNFGRVGGSTLTIGSAQTYTGWTFLTGGTNTTLRDNAALTNTSGIDINLTSLFLANNDNLQIQNNNRINDAAAINLRGGTLTFTGRVHADATETLGDISALMGANTISANTGGTGTAGAFATAVLTINSLTRSAGSTVNFTGTNLGSEGNAARIVFNTLLTPVGNGVLGAWAIANTSDYAAYNGSQGVGVVGNGGFVAYDPDFGSGNITNLGQSSAVALSTQLAPGTTTTGLLRFHGGFNNDLTFTSGGDILHLELGGILRSNNNNATTIGTLGSRGVITSGTNELVVYHNQNTLTIHSLIQGATSLVKSGGGTLLLTGQNSYSGGTVVDQGTLQLGGDLGDVVIPLGGLTVTGATVTMLTNPGQINAGNTVTLNGSSTLTLVGNNTLDSIVFNHMGGTGAPTVATGGVLTLTNANAITVTSNNAIGAPTVSGFLDLGSSAKTFSVGLHQMNGVVYDNTINPSLTISAVITGFGGSITKSGDGLMLLSAANTFTGGINVTGGGIVLGASSTSTFANSLTSGPLGLGAVSMSAGTRLAVNDSSRTVANAFTFAGNPVLSNTGSSTDVLTLNGALTFATLGTTGLVANIDTPYLNVVLGGDIQGIGSVTAIGSTGPNTISKTGPGNLSGLNLTGLGATVPINLTNLTNTAFTLLHDGDSTSGFETINLGTVTWESVNGALNLTIGRAGAGLYFPTAAYKTIALASLNSSSLPNGIVLTNSNGYGLVIPDNITLAATNNWSVSAANTSLQVVGLTLSGIISGNANFTKAGAGVVKFTNAGNSFTGTIDITDGLVEGSSDAVFGDPANIIQISANNLAEGLRISGTFDTSRTIHLNGASSGIDVTGTNTLTLNSPFTFATATNGLAKNDLGTLVLTQAQPGWNGVLTVNQGVLRITNADALGTTTGSTTISNIASSLELVGGLTVAEPLVFATSDDATNSGVNGSGAVRAVSGNNVLTGGILINTASGTADRGRAATITVDSGATLDIQGVITGTVGTLQNTDSWVGLGGAGAGTLSTAMVLAGTPGTNRFFVLNKFGSGSWNITAANVHPGTRVVIKEGTLILSGAGTLGTPTAGQEATATVYLNPTGVLTLDSSGTDTDNRLSGRALNLAGADVNIIGSATGTQETIGAFTLREGLSVLTLDANAAGPLNFATGAVARSAGATLLVRGDDLGAAAGNGVATMTGSAYAFAGQTGATGATNKAILPWALGDTSLTGSGEFFLTADSATGVDTGSSILRPLQGSEQTANFATANANVNLATTETLAALMPVNSLRLGNGGGVNLSHVPLTLESGGLLVLAGNTGIDGFGGVSYLTTVANRELIMHVVGDLTLNVPVAGTTGVVTKSGPGTLTLTAGNTAHGTVVVNDGILKLGGGDQTILPGRSLILNHGGTLDLNGTVQHFNFLESRLTAVLAQSDLFPDETGGVVLNSSGTQATLVLATANTTFTGSIQGNIAVVHSQAAAAFQDWNLYGEQTYTGPSLFNGGRTQLLVQGRIGNTASIEIANATFVLSGSNGTTDALNITDRIGDTIPITLRGGSFQLNTSASYYTRETVGDVTLAGGQNVISMGEGGTRVNQWDLTLASLTNTPGSHSTVRFYGLDADPNDNSRLFITAAPTLSHNLIGGWAVFEREFASYTTGQGVGGLNTQGYAGYSPNPINESIPADNIRIALPAAGSTTVLTGSRTINSLNLQGAASSTGNSTLDLGGNTLTLVSGGLLASGATDNIAISIINGNLTAGALDVGGDLYLHTFGYVNGNTDTVNRDVNIDANIVDNGAGPVAVVYNGDDGRGTGLDGLLLGESTNVTGNNTYSGGTWFNAGRVILNNTNANGTTITATGSGNVTISGGPNTLGNTYQEFRTSVIFGGPDQIANTATITLVGSGRLNLNNFNQTVAGLVIDNIGGHNPEITTGTGTLTLTGDTITASGQNASTSAISTIAGRLELLAANTSIVVNPVQWNGRVLNPILPNLVISASIEGGNIIKGGDGVLRLTGANAFTGIFDLQAGGLALGNNNALSTGTLMIGNNTFLAATTDAIAVSNPYIVSGNFALRDAFNLTLSGAGTLTAGSHAISVELTQKILTLSGVLSGAASINKTGDGILVLGNSNNTYNGSTTVTDGILRYGVANAVPVGSAVTVLEGGMLDITLGGASVAVGSLAGNSATQGGVVYHGATTGTNTLTVGADNTSTSFGGVITNAAGSTLNLVKTGSGTFTLGGENTYNGSTTVENGRLVARAVAGGSPLGTSQSLVMGGGTTSGVLQIGDGSAPLSHTFTVLSSEGAGTASQIVSGNAAMATLTLNLAATSTFRGNIGGAGANEANLNLVKSGAGDLTISGTGASTYNGTTTVSGGKLFMDTPGAFSNNTSSLTLADGTEFSLRGTSNLANQVYGFTGAGNKITVGTTTGATLGFGIDGGFNSQLNLAAGQTMTVNGSLTTAIYVNNAPIGGQKYVLINGTDAGSLQAGGGTFNLNPVIFNGGSFSYTLQFDSGVNGGGLSQWVLIPTAVAAAADTWWKGDLTGLGAGGWSATTTSGPGFPSNWDTDQTSGTDAVVPPDSGSIVHFSANGAANFATTLGANLTIQELIFHTGNTATTIGSSNGTNTLTLGNATDASGLTIQAGAADVSFSAIVAVAKDQAWNINDTGRLLTLSGGLTGSNVTLTVNNTVTNAGNLLFSGSAATMTGTLAMNAGVLIFEDTGSLSSGLNVALGTAATAATLQVGGTTAAALATIGGLSNGTFAGSRVVGGNAALSTLAIGPSIGSATFSGALGGAGTNENQFNLEKTGAGTQILNGAVSHAGTTVVRDGTLQLGAASAFAPTGALSVIANAGTTATFDFNGKSFTTTGNLTLGGGAAGIARVFDTNATKGLLTLGGNIIYDAANNPGNAAISTNINTGGANRVITVGNSTGSTNELTLSGTISSTTDNNLTFNGAGSGTISGNILLAWSGGTGATNDVIFASTGTWTINAKIEVEDDIAINNGIVNANAVESLDAADDVVITGTGTQGSVIVNLNSASQVHTGDDIFIRGGAIVNVNTTNAINTGTDQLLVGDSGSASAAAAGVLNLAASLSIGTNGLVLGAASGNIGNITGAGTITTGGSKFLRNGTIESGIILAGNGAITKETAGTVAFFGERAAASTGATNLFEGVLLLDYSLNNNSKIGGILNLGQMANVSAPTLTINGSSTDATTQGVTSTTIVAGNSTVAINNGAGQTATLNLGALTRAISATTGGGVVTFEYSSTDAKATSTSPAGTLGWATVSIASGVERFAAIDGGGDIVQAILTTQNDVTQWGFGQNIINSGAFTGAVDNAHIASLTFNASLATTVGLTSTGHLLLSSGGILVDSGVGAFSTTIQGGKVYGATSGILGELIIHQNNTFGTLTIASQIVNSGGITKTGLGMLVLSGNNSYVSGTGSQVSINEGTLRVAGGNAIGDTTNVYMRQGTTLDLANSNEVIGHLVTNSTGTIALGTGDITLNQTASSTYAGVFTGIAGSLITVNSAGFNFNLTGSTTSGFVGTVVINSGLFQLSGASARLNGATAFTLNKGANILIDNNDDGAPNDRISETATFTLNSADGNFSGETRPRGLAIRSDNNAAEPEGIGALTFNSGASYASLESSGGTSSQVNLTAANFARLNFATFNVRGRTLGGTAANSSTQFKILDGANEAAFLASANLVGGGALTGAGNKNISIVPWAIGENLTAALADTNMGNTLVTYVDNRGFVPLDLTTEYAAYTGAGAQDNVRESITASLSGLAGQTINSLVIHNHSTAASTLNVSGAGAGTTLVNSSGAFLFTLNPAATASTAHKVTVDGFDDGIQAGAGNEYVFFVVNPSSAATTPTLTATISSPLNSPTAAVTKSGRGTLEFTAVNTYSGGTTVNEGVLLIHDSDNIGSGGLTLAGGTVRLATDFTDDLGGRNLVVHAGGGTLEVQGTDVVATNLVTSGTGTLTKTGVGTLQIAGGTANTHTGDFAVTRGTVELNKTAGVNAISGGNLLIGFNSTVTQPSTVRLLAANQIANSTNVSLRSAGTDSVATLDLNGFAETVGSLTMGTTTGSGALVTTGAAGVLTLGGDITFNSDRATNDAATNARNLVITGTGTAGTAAPNTGTLNLGGVTRTITVQTTATGANAGNNDATIETAITSTGNAGIIKEGSRALVLSGANTYTGATSVNNGELNLRGSLGTGAVTVSKVGATLANAAVLSGGGDGVSTGIIRGSVIIGDINDAGVLSPGSVPSTTTIITNYGAGANGTMTLTAGGSALTVADGSQIQLGITTATYTSDGVASALAGSTYADAVTYIGANGSEFTTNWNVAPGSTGQMDFLNLTGASSSLSVGNRATATFGDGAIRVSLVGATSLAVGQVFNLIDWQSLSSIAGNFDTGGSTFYTGANIIAGDLDLPTLSAGLAWDVSAFAQYGVLVIVPEPSRAILLLLGLLGLMLRRRRR
ncbi:MAG: autotransporter-associated beta strand repeat-containing protein [Prosthecobacter sp.]